MCHPVHSLAQNPRPRGWARARAYAGPESPKARTLLRKQGKGTLNAYSCKFPTARQLARQLAADATRVLHFQQLVGACPSCPA